MGEWMQQIPVKLPLETVEKLDLLRGAYPFKPGRSTVIRELVEEGLRLIAEGILQFRAQAVNRVPSVQSIPGTPQEFPAQAFPAVEGRAKAPTRVHSLGRGARRGEVRGISRRSVLAELEVLAAYYPPVLGKVSPINSTPYAEVA